VLILPDYDSISILQTTDLAKKPAARQPRELLPPHHCKKREAGRFAFCNILTKSPFRFCNAISATFANLCDL
jgi:hypothetical protein